MSTSRIVTAVRAHAAASMASNRRPDVPRAAFLGVPELVPADLLAPAKRSVRRYGDVLAAHGRWCAIAAPTDGDDALARASVVIGSFEFEKSAAENGLALLLDPAGASGARHAWRGMAGNRRSDGAPAHPTELRPAARESSSLGQRRGFAWEARPRFAAECVARDQSKGEHFGCALSVLDLDDGDPTSAVTDRIGVARGLCAIGVDRAAAAEPLCGAVDLFVASTSLQGGRFGVAWTLDARVSPSDARAGDAFGASVALGRGFAPLLAVGAPHRDLGAVFDAGRVHVFARYDAPTEPVRPAGTAAVPTAPLATDSEDGTATAVRGHHDAQWIELAAIDPPQPAMSGRFGATVAMHGDLLAVGAPDAPNGTLQACGAVHLYRVAPNGCVHLGTLEPPEPQPWLWYGAALALDGRLLVVGSPGASAESGAARTGVVHVYELNALLAAGAIDAAAPWTIVPAGLRHADSFGRSVALQEGWLVAGAPGVDPPHGSGQPGSTIEDAGAAWLIDVATVPADRHGTPAIWSLATPEPGAMALFGASSAVVGAEDATPIVLVGHRYLEEESAAPSAGVVVFIPP